MKRSGILKYACILLFFVALVCSFMPSAIFGGKKVDAPDYASYLGMSKEVRDWNAAHPDDRTAWTGSMFSGMPTITIYSNSEGNLLGPVLDILAPKSLRPACFLFLSLLGAFLLMLVLGISPLLAAGGAVAVTFCSYNFQIIQVGHNTKMMALALLPWVLAALIFTYKNAIRKTDNWKKWLPATFLGAVLFGFTLAFQLKANHVQISWYLALICVVYVVGLLVWICLSKERISNLLGRFAVASGLLLATGAVGVATNACELMPLWEYTTQTMRGGSELSGAESKGLSIDYSTKWSYSWNELPNLMIPNFNGGPSVGPLPENSHTGELLRNNDKDYRNTLKSQPLYWGDQPNTAGPMYVGVITVFLFILGLMVCDGKDKWWMLAAALVSIGLALGNSCMPLTRLFHDYIPFYNKFRAVSTSLVVLQFMMPMLGFMALDKCMKGGSLTKEYKKKGLIAFGITGGLCLLFCLVPDLAGSFQSPSDADRPALYAKALAADRRALLRKDAFFSLLFVAGAYLLFILSQRKNASDKSKDLAALGICALVLVSMFGTGTRYLNESHFKTPRKFEESFTEREVDKIMAKDKDPHYRVVDLKAYVFSESKTSYFHKSIGGYNAAKLQRYQDLITRYLENELVQVTDALKNSVTFGDFKQNLGSIPALSMLNTKYFIYTADHAPLENPQAMGNAWFVESGLAVSSPDDELSAIGKTDLAKTAILGPDFKNVSIPRTKKDNDWITLVSYAPNELRYRYRTASDRAAVFSEIYYPYGWTAKIDGELPVDIFRTDWTLRGIILPAGSHELVMRMDPPSYKTGSRISLISSIFLYLLLAAALVWLKLSSGDRKNP